MQCTRRLKCGHFSDFIAQQGDDRWDSGPEEGGLAKSHAARLLSELSGYEKLHGLMVHTGAAQALADRGQELVCSLQLLHCMLEPQISVSLNYCNEPNICIAEAFPVF